MSCSKYSVANGIVNFHTCAHFQDCMEDNLNVMYGREYWKLGGIKTVIALGSRVF